MSLRRKILIYVGLTTLCLLTPLYIFTQQSLLQKYERMELHGAHESMKINLLSFFDEYANLGTLAVNYASWDDAYAIMGRPAPPAPDSRFMKANFPDTMYPASRLNLTLMLNDRSEVYVAKAYDYAADREEPYPEEMIRTLRSVYPDFLRHTDESPPKSGLLLVDGRPMIAASYPILTSNNEGPARGVLLFARYVDGHHMNHISSKTGMRMTFTPVPSGYRAPADAEALDMARSGSIPYWYESGDDSITGYSLLSDVSGEPAVLLAYEQPRQFMGEARKSMTFYLGYFGLVAIVFFFTVSSILERLIFARLNRTVHGMNTIETRQDFTVRIEETGSDEFTKLERSFNHMMESLERAQIAIRFQANHDQLTGLSNRNAFFDYLGQRIGAAGKQGGRFAILFIDLDRFKLINDTIGHHIGDLLLVEVSRRLSLNLRDNDFLFRLGGDEFCIVTGDAASRAEVERFADRLKAAIDAPYELGGYSTTISASIGISRYPDHGADPETLFHRSDTAMLDVKDSGKNDYRWYSHEIEQVRSRRLLIEQHLKHAIEGNELDLHYQAKWDLKLGGITGVEALLRWHHPQLGHVSPGEFIPVAESFGMINELGEWIMRTACRQFVAWRDELTEPPLRIAINISGVQLLQPRFAERIRAVFAEEMVDPKHFELEVTESFAIENFGEVVKILGELRDLGFLISIDDFGAGYSSMKYLLQLPIHCMKIDKTLIDELGHNKRSQVVVSTLIEMARRLDLTVVAEGVELPEQLRVLESYRCDQVQGYLLSKPLPAAGVPDLLARQKRPE